MQRHYYVIDSLLINSMRLTNDDKSSIKLLRQKKGWGAKRICKEFPNKKWSVSSVKDREFGGSQEPSSHLLGQLGPTVHQQSC